MEEQHALWIDRTVLLLLRERMPLTLMHHYPLSYLANASKMGAEHNEHRTWDVGAIHCPVKEQYTLWLWEDMVEITSHPNLAGFCGMFLTV